MNSEFETFIKVWLYSLSSLTYIHTLIPKLPSPISRFIATLPVIYLYYKLPWLFTSIFLKGLHAFFFTWLTNFKIILLCFDAGPLITHIHSLPHFLIFASLPILAKPKTTTPNSRPQGFLASLQTNPFLGLIVNLILTVPILKFYSVRKESNLHPIFLLIVYSLHMYVTLNAVYGCVRSLARIWPGVDLEPQFNKPYLSSSLTDFWGRRWNLIVTHTLRPSVYLPVMSACSRVMTKDMARATGLICTFAVSGIIHELIIYYVMEKPTWEWLSFFVLHGVLTLLEAKMIKVASRVGVRLATAVSVGLTLTVLVVTSWWLFFSVVTREELDLKLTGELYGFADWVNGLLASVGSLDVSTKSLDVSTKTG